MFENDTVLQAIQTGFSKSRILVVGDLMLDRYLWGDVGRISPEAPVPVVCIARRSEVAGGAANAAMNLARLGVQTFMAGVVGQDAARDSLLGLLRDQSVDTSAVVDLKDYPTTTKTRIIGGHQQMLRLDEEEVWGDDAERDEKLLARVLPGIRDVDAVILSDYAKGVLSPACCQTVISAARRHGVPVLVDPKGKDFSKYAGATAITPNLKEVSVVAGMSEQNIDALLATAEQMQKSLDIETWIITRGEQGISLVDGGDVRHFPAVVREVFDVSGAGDTVIATVAASIAAGLSWNEALPLANVAAGVVVGKVGTAPITQSELLRALQVKQFSGQAHKVCSRSEVLSRVAEWRARGERIVFTNGCFDLIHVGHVTYLEQARLEGHRLVVGLNTDRSVRVLKGEERPVVTEQDRARVLASLASVDAVVLFDEETPLKLIQAVRPDVLVKGSDYTVDQVVGAQDVKGWGGKVVLIPLVQGRSTSDILGKVKDLA